MGADGRPAHQALTLRGLGAMRATHHTYLMFRVLVPVLALFWLLAEAPHASADQTDKRLDKLFADLKATSNPVEGEVITESIWHIWYETTDRKAEKLLSEGRDAMANDAFDVALADFDRLVQVAPNFAEGWNRRATLLYMMGELDRSVRDIERTLELEPRHFGALSGLGLVYMQMGDEKAALKAFKQALEINPHLEGVKENIELLEKSISGRAI